MDNNKIKEMAERTTILRHLVGSTIYGLHLPGKDDRDEMGICIEDLDAAVGFQKFEQFIYRSAAEREHKHDAPSQPGDLDLCIYSLAKWLRLALQGNPTVLTLLFVPSNKAVFCDARGRALQEQAPKIVSKQAGERYIGYLRSQRQRMLNERGGLDVHREDLVKKFGYDTKYAMHMVRLGFQGCELLSTGRIELPMPEPTRAVCMRVREGKASLNEVLQLAGDLESDLKDLIETADMQEHPDTLAVQKWMLDIYFEAWKNREPHRVYLDLGVKIDG